jgi:Peptidase inhibitor family I36
MKLSSHRRRLIGLALATAAAAPLILVMSGVAEANTPPNCPSSTLCTYQNAQYNQNGGTQWNFPYSSTPHQTWTWVGTQANDKISSLYNNRAWVSYFGKNCPVDSQTYAFVGGEKVQDLTGWQWPNGSGMNDTTSAIALGTSTSTQRLYHGSC